MGAKSGILPRRATEDLLGRSQKERAINFLLTERGIAPKIVDELQSNGSLYASEYTQNVFVHRDPLGYPTGCTVRDKVTPDEGHFYIGDMRSATRFIFASSPIEALRVKPDKRRKSLIGFGVLRQASG